MLYGLFYKGISNIYELPSETKVSENNILSSMTDEALHGMGAIVTGPEKNGFLPVNTYYHYTGYVKKEDLLMQPLQQVKEWEASDLMIIKSFTADVMSLPGVHGIRITTLTKGAIVSMAEWDMENSGWAKVRLANGFTGYIRNQFLQKKEFSQCALWEENLPQAQIRDESEFRNEVVNYAMTYMGIQYRWGGKSTLGIDCSGLTSMAYMMKGILIYRDAKLMPDFPVKEISYSRKKRGDLLYFPGHIAMYIGKNRYIHATGRAGSGGVVINSLNSHDDDYREDLVKSLYAVGSIFE